MLDYGARFYDPVVGRFTTIDPLSANFPWMTNYQYASNNPVTNIDLDGLEGLFFGFNPALLAFGNSSLAPKLAPVGELARLAPENIAKAGGELVKAAEEHHILPRAIKENPFIEEARNGGFKFEGKENKMALDKYSKASGEGQHGNHPKYTTEMEKQVGELARKNEGSSPSEKASLLRDLVKDTKELINNNPGTKLNDLFKNPPAAQDNTKVVIPNIMPVVPPPPPKKEEQGQHIL